MSVSALKATTIATMIGAALVGYATTAEAQLGSVLRRVMPKPRPAAAPPAQPEAQPPRATGQLVRVKVTLHVTGAYQHSGHKTFPEGAVVLPIKRAIDNTYTTEYVVAAEAPLFSGLQKVNPLDPASQREMEAYQATVKAREDRIYHSADDLRGRGPGAPASVRRAANPMAMMDPAVLQKILACRQDQACKQRLALELMAQQHAHASGVGGAVVGDIQAISNACVAKGSDVGSKSYETCMNAEGEKRSIVARSAADDAPDVAELPDRYRVYLGGCQQVRAHVKIHESGVVGIVDTGGYVEGAGTAIGEGTVDTKNMEGCPGQIAFDTQTDLFWGGALVALNLDGQVARTGSMDATGGGYLSHDITEWVATAMRGAPASGTETRQFGYQTATVTWSYVRE